MKQYNNEKAIISLTSWKKRINTVSRTIFSLQKQCPGFHIVLVLSEDEFPKKEEELPEDLLTFLDTNIFELLWVKKNYKAFKKWLFTAQKYPDVPIITADDGCVYVRNYAEELYKEWLKHTSDIVSFNRFVVSGIVLGGGGSGIIFPPSCFENFGIDLLIDSVLNTQHDDFYYGMLAKLMHKNWRFINKTPNENNFKNIVKGGISLDVKPNTVSRQLYMMIDKLYNALLQI